MEFDVSAEQIFPYLVQPERIQQWFSGLIAIDPFLDAAGQPLETATQRVLQDAKGKRTTYQDSVLRYTINQMLAVKSRSDHGDTTWVYQLEPSDDGRTKVTLRAVTSASGMARLLAPLNQNVAMKQIEIDIRALKDVAESQPAPPLPTPEPPAAPDAIDTTSGG
jgi:uncharacterized protein YndB with AHSA1/START domain